MRLGHGRQYFGEIEFRMAPSPQKLKFESDTSDLVAEGESSRANGASALVIDFRSGASRSHDRVLDAIRIPNAYPPSRGANETCSISIAG